jgi:hypothetical protein
MSAKLKTAPRSLEERLQKYGALDCHDLECGTLDDYGDRFLPCRL